MVPAWVVYLAVAMAVLITTAVMHIVHAINSYGRHQTGTRIQVITQLSEAREQAHREGYAQGFHAGQTARLPAEPETITEPIPIPPQRPMRWQVQIIPAQMRRPGSGGRHER